MTGRYEGERPLGLFGGHEVEKAVHGGLARVGAFSGPVDRHADYRPPHHGQIEDGGGIADAAAIFSSADIQAQVKARFDAPILAVGLQH